MSVSLVIDLGVGNIGSVVRMLARIGVTARVIQSPPRLADRTPVVLPGVGHFARAVEALDAGWRGWLQERHESDSPLLAICLGAQLMCESSEEGPGAGLGWVQTRVRRFPGRIANGRPLRVPSMGWQAFSPPEGCLPFDPPPGRMYYAHSYFIEPAVDSATSPYQAEYGGVRFASVIRSGRAIGVQFHPEKSHRHGMAFARSWFEWALASGPA